jgi:flagellar hook-associated protein 3 FlgL
MRIADKMQFNQVQQNTTKNRNEMYDLQNQAASQKRINKPSDDPLATTRVLGQRTEQRGNTQFVKNINNAKSFLEFTDQSLGELGDILVRAKELAIAQANDAGASEETRQVSGLEVNQILSQAIQIGNRKLGERAIFGGYKTQDTPFDQSGNYKGDDGEMKIQTHKDAFITMNLPGSKVFLGKGVSGDGSERSHLDSPKTVEDLNEVLSEEQKLHQINQQKEDDFVQMRGPASTGKPGQISKKDPITHQSGVNIFQVLEGLEVSMRTNDKEGIQSSLDSLDQAISQVVLSRSEVGSRIMAVNSTTESLQKAIVDNKILASQLEDADVYQVVSDINKTDSALKATLEVSPKLIQTSLLDFIK